jgi:hypothetical protein
LGHGAADPESSHSPAPKSLVDVALQISRYL